MFEKDLTVSYLLDFYGDILSEHQRTILSAYYNDDLSLAEIAESCGISRQGVRHIIKKSEEELSGLEEKLGLAAQFRAGRQTREKLLALLDTALEMTERGDTEKVRACLTEARTLMGS